MDDARLDALKALPTVGSSAMIQMLERVPDVTLKRIEEALKNGHRLAITLAADLQGASEIQLDLLSAGGDRFRVATLSAGPVQFH
ncbi:hypothetical protein ACL598_18850 [Bordetella bronchialis]|uniref:hypothetical protein n=1 Tax=Bordetella bronchialis TaxID=463025 RepID=UPI003D090CB7